MPLDSRAERRAADAHWRIAAAACASVSLVALVFHVIGVLPMSFFLQFTGVPSVVLLILLAAGARVFSADAVVRNLQLGLLAGLAGTAVYDVVRFLAYSTGWFDFDPFFSAHIFGGWITGQPRMSAVATTAGWLYHLWNGLAFGVLFMLTFGRPKAWWWGLIYGAVMEACMLGLFPLFLQVSDQVGFITISMIGHAAYGATVGAIAARRGVPWAEVAAS